MSEPEGQKHIAAIEELFHERRALSLRAVDSTCESCGTSFKQKI